MGQPQTTNIRLHGALRNSVLLLMGRWPFSPALTHTHQQAIHFTVTWLQGTLCIYKCVSLLCKSSYSIWWIQQNTNHAFSAEGQGKKKWQQKEIKNDQSHANLFTSPTPNEWPAWLITNMHATCIWRCLVKYSVISLFFTILYLTKNTWLEFSLKQSIKGVNMPYFTV